MVWKHHYAWNAMLWIQKRVLLLLENISRLFFATFNKSIVSWVRYLLCSSINCYYIEFIIIVLNLFCMTGPNSFLIRKGLYSVSINHEDIKLPSFDRAYNGGKVCKSRCNGCRSCSPEKCELGLYLPNYFPHFPCCTVMMLNINIYLLKNC